MQNQMINLKPAILIIILNVNGLNTSVKRKRISDGIKEQEIVI